MFWKRLVCKNFVQQICKGGCVHKNALKSAGKFCTKMRNMQTSLSFAKMCCKNAKLQIVARGFCTIRCLQVCTEKIAHLLQYMIANNLFCKMINLTQRKLHKTWGMYVSQAVEMHKHVNTCIAAGWLFVQEAKSF